MAEENTIVCPCDRTVVDFEPRILSGLDALPRQTRTFANVRQALLAGVRGPTKPALRAWSASGERDLGLLLLEMWAYLADVLNFYDERVANESYLRTANRRSSVRRLVELLGYVQAPGIAGTIALGAIADGRLPTTLPAGTGFRSDAFDSEPPQVFELDEPATIDPRKNEWRVGPLPQPLPQLTPSAAAAGHSTFMKFVAAETSNLGISADAYVQIRVGSTPPHFDQVLRVQPFQGVDGSNYAELELRSGLSIASGTRPAQVALRTPATRAGVYAIDTVDRRWIYLDALYPGVKPNDYVLITTRGQPNNLRRVQVLQVSTGARAIHTPGASPSIARIPVTALRLDAQIYGTPSVLEVHFDWVQAGRITTVRSPTIRPSDVTSGNKVALEGILQAPRGGASTSGELLLQGASDEGAHVNGTVQVDATGRGTLTVEKTWNPSSLPELSAPLHVYGNVLTASRGESVLNEVLGSGDPRVPSQSFELKKKPLTYLDAPELDRGIRSTLSVRVDGVVWREVPSFYGCGPNDNVFIVRHDDEQATLITFGDGRRGARLPSGVDNVVASYRFGSGSAVPPAGKVSQLAKAVPGIRSVRAPVAALPGRDPDSSETLRTTVPRSLLLLGRAISVSDFEALASQVLGVVRASAEYRWLPDEQTAGVSVRYVGGADKEKVLAALLSKADPNLEIEVRRAEPITRTLVLNILTLPEYRKEDIELEVHAELLRPGGVLSVEVAPIGGQFWVSRVYEVAQRFRGVVAVTSGTMGGAWTSDLAPNEVFCVPNDRYFDFSGAQAVTIHATTASDVQIPPQRTAGEL